MRDLRFALRLLLKNPRFSLTAILALALTIGATVVIFSIVDSLFVNPLPYRENDRRIIFYIHDVAKPDQRDRNWYTPSEFLTFRAENLAFRDLVATAHENFRYTTREATQEVVGVRATTNLFEVLGVEAMLGRLFNQADGESDASAICVITYRWWARQFGEDPKIVGTTVLLNDIPTVIVGVLPPHVFPGNADAYTPVGISGSHLTRYDGDNADPEFELFGELKPGMSLQSANANLEVIAQQLARSNPSLYPPRFTVRSITARDWSIEQIRVMLYALVIGVGMLLLIGSGNVANLLLARATARGREVAIRMSVGASTARLILQFLLESLVLAVAGAAVGVALAYYAVKLAAAVTPQGMIPPEAVIELKPVCLWFALGVTFLTTFLCGLAPALHSVRGDLNSRLSAVSKGVNGDFKHGKIRSALVVLQVSLSLVLLTGAGLMARTLAATERIELGFDPKGVLFTKITLPKGHYATAGQKLGFYRQVSQRVMALPSVMYVAESTSMPWPGGLQTTVTIPGKVHVERWECKIDLDSESYFRTLGIRLVRGRVLSQEDVDSGRHVAVINQKFARNYFGSDDPIGQTVKFGILDSLSDVPRDSYFEIVGIVVDIKNQGLRAPALPQAFLPLSVTGFGSRGILVKTEAHPEAVINSVRREIWEVDSQVALSTGPAQSGVIEKYFQDYSYAGPKFSLIMLGSFAGIGLLLVVIGVFSVMAYAVALRTHEMGIRVALGAQRRDVLKIVLANGLRLILTGIVIGLFSSTVLTRILASQVWGVSANDPLTFCVVASVIFLAGSGACLLPAWRATRVDPVAALRCE